MLIRVLHCYPLSQLRRLPYDANDLQLEVEHARRAKHDLVSLVKLSEWSPDGCNRHDNRRGSAGVGDGEVKRARRHLALAGGCLARIEHMLDGACEIGETADVD